MGLRAVESAGGYNTAAAPFPGERRENDHYQYWHRPYARSRKPPPDLFRVTSIDREKRHTFVTLHSNQ